MINIMIVEPQILHRQFFELLIGERTDHQVLFSLVSPAMAESCCERHSIDLILMDTCTGRDESGFHAAKRIKEKFPKTKIIIMTDLPEYSFISRAKAAGADSFWYKNGGAEFLLEIVGKTLSGESVYPDSSPEIYLGNAGSSDFTERELDVLRELTTGDPDTAIAEKLNMSVWTVRSHLKHMMAKTGFFSRTALAVAARASGLVIWER